MKMHKMLVEGLHDSALDPFVRMTDHELRSKREQSEGIMLVESKFAINVALSSGVEPISMLIDERHEQAVREMLEGIEGDATVPVYSLPREDLSEVVGFNVTRGYFCAMRRPDEPELDEVLASAANIAVLVDVVDTTNVGAIFRSAAALGAGGVVLLGGCADPLSRRSIRVSMGTVFQVPWVRVGPPDEAGAAKALGLIREAGFACVGMALDDEAIPLGHERLKGLGRRAVVLGGEGFGIPPEALAVCDEKVMIPMANGVDSLNVAASSAVAFWELFK